MHILLPLIASLGMSTIADGAPVPVPVSCFALTATFLTHQQPGIPSSSSARTQLAGLTVRAAGSMTGYSRDEFPHWIESGGCNTRETVLKRDGTNVATDSACRSTSGRWFSPYDGATWTAVSDVDIDHMVPLANSWIVSQLRSISEV